MLLSASAVMEHVHDARDALGSGRRPDREHGLQQAVEQSERMILGDRRDFGEVAAIPTCERPQIVGDQRIGSILERATALVVHESVVGDQVDETGIAGTQTEVILFSVAVPERKVEAAERV